MLTEADILWSDNQMLAVNKPAGLASQPSREQPDNLEDEAKAWVKAKFAKPGNVFLHAVHRLDCPVSGIVVFARTSKALSRLTAAIRERACRKVYLALLDGPPPAPAGDLVDWLLHDEFQARTVPEGSPGAQRAELRYETLAAAADRVLVRIDLLTGRYHQIRIQFGNRGCPVVGDRRYGAKSRLGDDRIALHHWRLEIEHPVSHEALRLEAPVPEFMRIGGFQG